MPELPDLVRVEQVLGGLMRGRRVTGARTGDPTVLRVMVAEPFPALLAGRLVTAVERRGHFMRFLLGGDVVLVVNAMLVGRYKWLPPTAGAHEKDPVALGLALSFDDGSELRYVDDKRMGKIYVTRPQDEGRIPVYGALGVDVLSAGFDWARFKAVARKRRDQARMFLMDKRALASIGNAYADEILFAARIHPKTFVHQLSDGDLERLFQAIGQVLRHAIDEIHRRDQPIDVKVRDFLAVRGRDGKPCPRCGTILRAVRVGDGDACFCPSCQPTQRRLFVDWQRLPAATGSARAPAMAREVDLGAGTGVEPAGLAPAAAAVVNPPPQRERDPARPPAADETAPPRRRSRRSANPRRAPSGS